MSKRSADVKELVLDVLVEAGISGTLVLTNPFGLPLVFAPALISHVGIAVRVNAVATHGRPSKVAQNWHTIESKSASWHKTGTTLRKRSGLESVEESVSDGPTFLDTEEVGCSSHLEPTIHSIGNDDSFRCCSSRCTGEGDL